jgi:hypothetical protein
MKDRDEREDEPRGPAPERRGKKPVKPLPRWVEPVFIVGFCVAAYLEYQRGDKFWFWLFLLAAIYFGITNLLQRGKR